VILKGTDELRDLDTWALLAGPKRRIHWKDGRSAKESARTWLQASPDLPIEIREAVYSHRDFSELIEWVAEPEALVRFDSFRGEPANVDVLVHGKDAHGSVVIAIEAKADESFGGTVGQTLERAQSHQAANPRSKGVLRLQQLGQALFGLAPNQLKQLSQLRHQLMTVSAAALSEAERREASRALVVVHEFITSQTDDRRHSMNALDLNSFLAAIGAELTEIKAGQLTGPISVPGPPIISTPIGLYFGKACVNLRSGDA
jgi:hypothetical protein